MPSHTARRYDPGRRGASPLAATLRTRAPELLVVALVGTALALAVLRVAGIDPASAALAAHAPGATLRPAGAPLTYRFVELETAGTAGLAGAAAAAALYAARDHPSAALREGRVAFAAAGVAALSGAALGHAVGVGAIRTLVADGLVAVDGAGGAYWLTELAVTLPVVWAAAFALPFVLAGAGRAGLVPRRWTGRGRGIAAVAALCFAAVYSPPDSLTFVAAAGLLLAGLCAGVAALEFDLA